MSAIEFLWQKVWVAAIILCVDFVAKFPVTYFRKILVTYFGNLAIWTVHIWEKVLFLWFWVPREINSLFCLRRVFAYLTSFFSQILNGVTMKTSACNMCYFFQFRKGCNLCRAGRTSINASKIHLEFLIKKKNDFSDWLGKGFEIRAYEKSENQWSGFIETASVLIIQNRARWP